MEPQLIAARAAFEGLQVRATATGKVMGLSVFTPGGVIAPGQKLMDIVPDATPLVINAMVETKDGNDVQAGQEAQVRFTSLHERDVPILKGKVLDISADSFSDKDTNKSFYMARIEISPETFATLAGSSRTRRRSSPACRSRSWCRCASARCCSICWNR